MPSPALRAIIFDFNGVIADDEATHFVAFQQALREHGLSLTHEEYYGKYLGMDERNCVAGLMTSFTGGRDTVREQQIIKRKAVLFRERSLQEKPPLFPGAVDFVKQAGARYRLAIASGGTREQIQFALQGTPIEKDFHVTVAADDISIGKPDPEIYRLALALLNRTVPLSQSKITPEQCLIIEDSLAGIRAGLAAGMKVVAVSTTYPLAQLSNAHLVLPSLETGLMEHLESIFQ